MSSGNSTADQSREYWVDDNGYKDMYQASVTDPEKFWAEQAKMIKNTSFAPGNIDIKWFEDGQLNISENCIDRH
jgi:acetyl-CoA synthetase